MKKIFHWWRTRCWLILQKTRRFFCKQKKGRGETKKQSGLASVFLLNTTNKNKRLASFTLQSFALHRSESNNNGDAWRVVLSSSSRKQTTTAQIRLQSLSEWGWCDIMCVSRAIRDCIILILKRNAISLSPFHFLSVLLLCDQISTAAKLSHDQLSGFWFHFMHCVWNHLSFKLLRECFHNHFLCHNLFTK